MYACVFVCKIITTDFVGLHLNILKLKIKLLI